MHKSKLVGQKYLHGSMSVNSSMSIRTLGLTASLAILVALAVPAVFAQSQNSDSANSTAVVESNIPPTEEAYKPPKTPFSVSWDTSFKYSPIFRVAKQSNELIAPVTGDNAANPNLDDGDRDFHRGLVSNRLDIFSEVDVAFNGNFGIRGSTAAWGNPIYNQHTANTSPIGAATWNGVGSPRHFAAGTKDLEYLYAELMDAFFYGKVRNGKSLFTFKGGRFAQVWGQTLFMGYNGIAGGMAPGDIIKASSMPNVQFKELIRPADQIGAQWQYRKVSVGAYYQMEFEPSRLPTAGSYFSTADVIGDGAQRFFVGSGVAVPKIPDYWAKNWGQFGGQVLIRLPHELDLGFHVIQFHDKSPQILLGIGPTGPFNFSRAYQEGVKAVAFSATKSQGLINWGFEIGGHFNQDLGVPQSYVIGPPISVNNKNAPYPVGDTIHVNLSAFASNLKPNKLARQSSLLAEVAYNNLLSITKNGAWWRTTGSDKPGALALQALYTLTYDQVRPGLSLDIPIGLSVCPIGKSVLGPGGNFAAYQGGNVNFGVTATYHDKNKIGVTYQRYFGDQMSIIQLNPLTGIARYSYGQSMGDRNYIAFSFNRSFGLRASQKSH